MDCRGQVQGEAAAPTGLGAQVDVAAVQFCNAAAAGQADLVRAIAAQEKPAHLVVDVTVEGSGATT